MTLREAMTSSEYHQLILYQSMLSKYKVKEIMGHKQFLAICKLENTYDYTCTRTLIKLRLFIVKLKLAQSFWKKYSMYFQFLIITSFRKRCCLMWIQFNHERFVLSKVWLKWAQIYHHFFTIISTWKECDLCIKCESLHLSML